MKVAAITIVTLLLLASLAMAQQPVPVYTPPRIIGYRVEQVPVQRPVYSQPQIIGYKQPVLVPRPSLLPGIVRFRRRWVFVPIQQPYYQQQTR